MQVILLSLDSVLLYLHNSTLAEWDGVWILSLHTSYVKSVILTKY